MNKGYYITATNTERGKTLFTTGLTLWLRENGVNVMPMKPVQTGMEGAEIAPDLEYNFNITGIVPPSEDMKYIQPYCYQDPCSPHLAAERDGLPYPEIEHIKSCADVLSSKYECVLAEGAGGLFVPLNRDKNLCVIDSIKALDMEVLLVAQSGLGTINDTCLSIEALKNRGIKIAGFIFNDGDKAYGNDYIRDDNPKVISDLTNVKYLGRIPYLENINKGSLLGAFDELTELKKLFQ